MRSNIGNIPIIRPGAKSWKSSCRNAESRRPAAEARPSKGKRGLLTIGYEGKSLEHYLNLLLRVGDVAVRRSAQFLEPEVWFFQKHFGQGLRGRGIRYEHLPELGIDSDERRDLKAQGDYDALFAAYERKTLPLKKVALAKIRGWVEAGERVALNVTNCCRISATALRGKSIGTSGWKGIFGALKL